MIFIKPVTKIPQRKPRTNTGCDIYCQVTTPRKHQLCKWGKYFLNQMGPTDLKKKINRNAIHPYNDKESGGFGK